MSWINRVNTSGDDGWGSIIGIFDTDDGFNVAGWEDGAKDKTWLRFTNIPKNPSAASLRLVINGNSGIGSHISFRGFLQDNPTNPTDYNDLATRPRTVAQVFSDAPSSVNGTTWDIDITNILSELTARAGFNGVIIIVVEDDGIDPGGVNYVEFYDYDATQPQYNSPLAKTPTLTLVIPTPTMNKTIEEDGLSLHTNLGI